MTSEDQRDAAPSREKPHGRAPRYTKPNWQDIGAGNDHRIDLLAHKGRARARGIGDRRTVLGVAK